MNPIAAIPVRLLFLLAAFLALTMLPVGVRPASAADAALSVTAAVPIPGASAAITGSGFAPGEIVHITFGPQSIHIPASGTGSISTSLTIPTVPASLQFISGFGETSGKWSIAYLWVAGFNPLVAPNNWFLHPGAALSFAGTGFAPNENVTATYASSTLATFTTDGSGNFFGPSASLPVSLSNTTATVHFMGASSTAHTSIVLSIGQLFPSIIPSAWYTAAGSIISLTGSGFAPNEGVTVTAGSVTATTTANAMGSFSLPSLQLPSIGGGTVTITATGMASGASTNASVTLAGIFPWLTFSTYWAQGGSPLTIFGNSFAANEQVSLTAGSATVGTTTANTSGNFAFAGAVPFAPSGSITITGMGLTSGASAASSLTVAPAYVDLQLGSYAGAPGTAITFIGHGYLPNEPVQVMTDRTGSSTVASFTASAAGDLTGSYTTPADFIEGLLSLTVTGLHSFVTKTILYYVTGG